MTRKLLANIEDHEALRARGVICELLARIEDSEALGARANTCNLVASIEDHEAAEARAHTASRWQTWKTMTPWRPVLSLTVHLC